MSIPALLELAAVTADLSEDRTRRYYVGALAVRRDGTTVKSRNGSAQQPTPSRHAEVRVLRKAGLGADVYVARVARNGQLAMAKPCNRCMAILRNKGVRLVVYTTGSSTYEIVRL